MFQEFYPIRLQSVAEIQYLLRPRQVRESINLRSPALAVMTDFEQIEPVTVDQAASIDDALERMKSQHVRLLFALDSDGNFAGIITSADMAGDKPVVEMEHYGLSRDQLEVRHIMLPRAYIRALTYEQVQQSRIGDVMLTLKGSGDQHALVLDESYAGVKRIRGIISASDISRLLKIRFDVMYEVKSFAEIEQVITRGRGL